MADPFQPPRNGPTPSGAVPAKIGTAWNSGPKIREKPNRFRAFRWNGGTRKGATLKLLLRAFRSTSPSLEGGADDPAPTEVQNVQVRPCDRLDWRDPVPLDPPDQKDCPAPATWLAGLHLERGLHDRGRNGGAAARR